MIRIGTKDDKDRDMTVRLVFQLFRILIPTFLFSPSAHSVQCPARANHIGEGLMRRDRERHLKQVKRN